MRSMIGDYYRLIRVKHYIKNLLVFLPIVFSGNLFVPSYLWITILGFFTFSLGASAVYIFNDICDLNNDENHSDKKYRPIASKRISVRNASVLAVVLVILSVTLQILAFDSFSGILYLGIYILINCFYSLGLKNVPLVDVSIIVAGFILRVVFGGVINDIPISSWMYLMVMAMSFYLALGKRRNEIRKFGGNTRKVLIYYTEGFLDKMMYVSLSLSIVFYSMWCVIPENSIGKNSGLIWTVPIVLLICMRYSMNIERESDGDPAEVLLNDKALLCLVALYGIVALVLVYAPNFV